MSNKDRILKRMAVEARRRQGRLARELVYAPSEHKEDILAGLEIEGWLADACEEIVDNLPERHS